MNSEPGWLPVRASGRVQCVRRGEEVEFARCLACNWSLDLDLAAGTAAVRCAAVTPIPDGRVVRPPAPHVD